MKITRYLSFFLYLLGICLLQSTFTEAKIWTVDNTPGAGADTTNFSGAVVAASSGDTIIVMPSNSSYSGATINKKLFIYSRGHTNNNIDKDRSAILGAISFGSGSEGSVLKGLQISNLFINANNIYVQNCLITSNNYNYMYGSNCIVEGCIFSADNYVNRIYFGTTSASNNIIKNNYFSARRYNGSMTGSSFNFISGGNSTNLIINNVFVCVVDGSASISAGGFRFFEDSYCKIYNNIMYSNVPNQVPFYEGNKGSVFRNNVTYSAANNPSPLPGNNYNDTLPVFETNFSSTFLPYYRADNDMRLKSTSIGKNGGTDSTDCGLYGQHYPFSIEGNVQGVAIFQDFEVLNPVVKKGGTLKVKMIGIKPQD